MKKTFKLLSSLFIGIVMCFVMISCYGSKNSILEKIQNELGFVVEGGSFEQGSTLVSNVINQSSSEWNDVIEKIANQNYDENQEIFIYDIFVEKDGKEVQPNEKVKLSIPSPFEDGTNVVIYHVKSEGVETITPTYINGNLVFETSGFSYFVVAKQEETKKFNLKISVSYPGSVEVTNKETGQIVDRINEYSTRTLSVEEGQTYTISCDSCDAQYIFLGWYDQYGSPSMSESEPLSKEETFDFVMRSEDVTLTPYFVRKIDGFGFGTIDNPVVFEEVNVFEVGTNIVELLFQAQVVKVVDGFEYPLSFDYDYLIDYSDLDCEIPGEYTVTYKYRWEENFEKKITIIIEAKKYDFVAIVHQGIGGSLSLLAISDTQSISMSVPANEVMTLTAAAFDGYRFVGWYEVDIAESGQVILKDTPVSTNLTYEYVTKECNYMVYAVFEEVPTYNFTANQQGSGGYVEVVGTEYTINENTSYSVSLPKGTTITLKANVRSDQYRFLGWFEVDDSTPTYLVLKDTPVSTETTFEHVMEESSYTIYAVFEAKVTSLILDAANAGFTEGVATYTIGDEFVPNPEYVLVYGVTGDENIYLTLNEDYTIDLGGLDFNQAGTYTITYTYLKDSSIQATLVIEVVEKTVYFQATVIGHGKIYYNDVEQAENGYNADLKKGSNVTLVAVAEETSEFVGWFTATDIEVLISSESSYTFTIGDEDQYVFARFEAKVTSLILDAANAGFTEGEATYTIGDEFVPNPEYVLVYGVTVDENIYLTLNEDYTIDLGGLDFNQVGTYTITYTYLKDSSIQATLEVNVVSSEISADLLAYAGSNESSSRYNGGRAAYVFKSEFTYNGETCDIEDLGLFYEWRDRTTSEVIDVARDSTWDSTASHYPSPAVVGEYDFVVYKVEGENKVDMLTIHRTITEQTFALITDEASLSEYEDFTFVAKVDNSYYVMPTPMTTGAELEAIQVVPNENGVISLGNNYEYVFRPYDIGKTEADLTLYGMRTGHGLNRIGKLILWDNGLIEYSTGVSADYALTITFNEDYSVNVHNPYCHGTLHLVYDAETDRYLFTANTLNETRPTYPIFIYKEYEEVVAPTEVYEFYGKLDKQYDGEAVSVNIYKEINILTENGKDLFTLLKMGTIQFVWTDLKSNVLVTSTISEEGYIQGPSQVGSYQLVVQLLEKGETGMEWVDKAILTTFSILEA